MSKFTITSMLFLIVLFMMILIVQYYGVTSWIILVPIVIYLTRVIFGTVKISHNYFFESLCRASTTEKIIALTFDDGPHEDNTERLIELLDSNDAKAAFFCIGRKIEKNRNLIEKLDRQGHLIGNHSYTHHRYFDLFSSEKMTDELEKTNEIIEDLTGKKPVLFRPPYGVTNPPLQKAIQQTGMQSIGWSLRSFDTIHQKEKVLEKLKKKTRPGVVVLMHDTRADVLEITQIYLAWLKKEGYKVVSLEQLFNIHAYE
jgi:peptidoglycan/xylan/chitin deacetylase (PgdA/CDA1 family)